MERNNYNITLRDLGILLINFEKAFMDKRIGHGDFKRTKTEILNKLNKTVKLPKAILESCLWSCNMLDDAGDFWHPTKDPFMHFVRGLCKNDESFNPYYNMFFEDIRTYENHYEEE